MLLVLLSDPPATIPAMSVTISNRSDRFPVGTTVKAYPRAARVRGGKPSGDPVEEHAVGADGKLGPFTTLTADTPYTLYAEVAGSHQYLDVENSEQPAATTLKERLETAHAAVEA